jgi:hypothetical protein
MASEEPAKTVARPRDVSMSIAAIRNSWLPVPSWTTSTAKPSARKPFARPRPVASHRRRSAIASAQPGRSLLKRFQVASGWLQTWLRRLSAASRQQLPLEVSHQRPLPLPAHRRPLAARRCGCRRPHRPHHRRRVRRHRSGAPPDHRRRSGLGAHGCQQDHQAAGRRQSSRGRPGGIATSAELDVDRAGTVWEVELVTPDGVEHEVIVNADSGAVIGPVRQD